MIDAEAMSSVTQKKQRRRSILTKDLMAGIPVLVQQGLRAEPIAARLGCTVGTLKVRCSQQRISLRVPKEGQGGAAGASAQAANAEAVLCLCLADHTATQPSCHVPAAPTRGSHRRERSQACQ